MKYPIRRAQLISPFGTGAMSISKNGTSAVCSGLDHWFKNRQGNMDSTDLSQYKIKEWRLERMLGVSHFRLPPDFRKTGNSDNDINRYLTVPFLRFPKWNYCSFCGQMKELEYHQKNKELCKGCEGKGYKNFISQVPFIAMCEKGHLQDFPWREWVHKEKNTSCKKTLYLISTGGEALTSMQVKCECGVKPRMLHSITSVDEDGKTELSRSLCDDGSEFFCQGKRPWLGTDEGEECGCHLRASLRSASNVYFAQVRSAIYIPGNSNKQIVDLLSYFEQSQFLRIITLANRANLSLDEIVKELKEHFLLELNEYSDSDIRRALLAMEAREGNKDDKEQPIDMEVVLREEEYEVLNGEINQEDLRINPVSLDTYKGDIFDVSRYFSNIHLVEKLKETRVLSGFNRVFNDQCSDLEVMKSMLWRNQPSDLTDDWLPAYVVYGEGIFFNFNEDVVREWEQKIQVTDRAHPLILRYRNLVANYRTKEKKITPRFIMAHTFAHLLINQLVFECGYSSSSLRERLYVSDNALNPMCGVLIYTAAGDSDGTMGGLVRMGKPDYLEAVIQKAFINAGWCSADPVCTEIGLQGPNSCNLAACHSCSLIPETACEEFNHFLDRGLVVPLHGVDPRISFFN